MAKKKSQKNIFTHVPSHLGFGIIALVVIAFGLIILTQYDANNQTQTLQSQAAGNPPKPTVTTSKPVCISLTTTGKCTLYQSTTTTITSNKCISYNTSNKCTYYQDESVTPYTCPNPKNGSCDPSLSSSKSSGSKSSGSSSSTSNSSGSIGGSGTLCAQYGGTCVNKNVTSHVSGQGGEYEAGGCPGGNNIECWFTSTNGKGSIGGANTNCAKYGGTCTNKNTSSHVNGKGGMYIQDACPGGNNIQCWVTSK